MFAAARRQPDPVEDVRLPPKTAEQFATAMKATIAQLQDLHAFHQLLADWNGRMNLVGPSALADFWPRHAFDSAQLLHVEHSALRWADVGAGAGFPGIILAILLKGRAGACIDLIESMAKRVSFLRHVVDALSLPARVHHSRAEDLTLGPDLQMVTARACAPLPRLFSYTSHFFQAGAVGLFLKGRDVMSELTEARAGWSFDYELIPSLSDASGRLVRIQRLEPRG